MGMSSFLQVVVINQNTVQIKIVSRWKVHWRTLTSVQNVIYIQDGEIFQPGPKWWTDWLSCLLRNYTTKQQMDPEVYHWILSERQPYRRLLKYYKKVIVSIVFFINLLSFTTNPLTVISVSKSCHYVVALPDFSFVRGVWKATNITFINHMQCLGKA